MFLKYMAKSAWFDERL